jgi:hypothetical protein
METQNVTLDAKGHYSVLLGSSKPDGLPTDLFAAGEARWLGVQPDREAEQPRVLLLSVPYALKAMDAETLGGRPVSDFALVTPQNTNSAQGKKHAGTASDAAQQGSGPATVTGTGTKNFIPIWTSTTALGNSTIFETASKVGVGTTTPATVLDINGTGGFRDTLTLFPKGSVPTLAVQGTAFQVKNNGLVTFVSRQTFPGAGTITGVTAGTDLTGGGTSGNVTLNLNTSALQGQNDARYAQLGANNKFTGNQQVLGNVVVNNGIFGNSASFTGNTSTAPIMAIRQSGFAEAMDIFSELTSGLLVASGGNNISAVAGQASGATGFNIGLNGLSRSSGGIGTAGYAIILSKTGQGQGCCPVGVWGDTGSNLPGAAGLVGTADDGRAIYLQNNSPSGVPTLFAFNSENTKQFLPVLVEQGAFGSCTFDTNGNEFCTGNITPVVAVKQGSRKAALYAVASPENWFEDFGSGRLSSGSATIVLDADFAETVNTSDDYHVFLTPNGECKGLFVSQKSASSFEVHEIGGGSSSISFDYRMVAHRKGQEGVRMADMTERMPSQEHLPVKNKTP